MSIIHPRMSAVVYPSVLKPETKCGNLPRVLFISTSDINSDWLPGIGLGCLERQEMVLSRKKWHSCKNHSSEYHHVGFELLSSCRNKLWINAYQFIRPGFEGYKTTNSNSMEIRNKIHQRNCKMVSFNYSNEVVESIVYLVRNRITLRTPMDDFTIAGINVNKAVGWFSAYTTEAMDNYVGYAS